MPIAAVYKKGVIKPLVEVDLRENERIEIEIKRKKEAGEITKKITGSLALEDEKLIDAIVESEDWL
ncbi:MAG: antitoxin family protein [Methanobacteriota archaeon]